jgi:ABC-type multidrug transport system fused ATPase/permease subunit
MDSCGMLQVFKSFVIFSERVGYLNMNNWMVFMPVLAVKIWAVVMIILIVVLIGALVALSIYGKKLQDRQEESQKQLQAAAQNASFLVIDKKRLKLKDSGLPQIVIDQTPKRFRGQKVPIVKAKIGSQIMSLMCDEKIFEQIPVKKSVKARVSGIYILEVKGLRTNLEGATGKRSFRSKMQDKLQNLQKKTKETIEQDGKASKKEKSKKTK